MLINGQIQNGAIIPDHPLVLPEGTRVRVEVERTVNEELLPREGGWWQGRIQMAEDFDELPEDIAKAFGVDVP